MTITPADRYLLKSQSEVSCFLDDLFHLSGNICSLAALSEYLSEVIAANWGVETALVEPGACNGADEAITLIQSLAAEHRVISQMKQLRQAIYHMVGPDELGNTVPDDFELTKEIVRFWLENKGGHSSKATNEAISLGDPP